MTSETGSEPEARRPEPKPTPQQRDRAMAALADSAYGRLWDRARHALERTGGSLEGSIELAGLSAPERKALTGLLGRAPARESVRVKLAELDECLLRSAGVDLVVWLESVGGPLRNRPAERHARRSALESLRMIVEHGTLAERPWVGDWLDSLTRDGLLAKMARDETGFDDLAAAIGILGALPADDIPLAVLAARVTGDTKRLTMTRVRTLVERSLAIQVGLTVDAVVEERTTTGASLERRMLWRHFGVRLDDVSSTVLVLGLCAVGDTPLDRWLRDAAGLGVAMSVTLAQLERWAINLPSDTVHVCENPAVVGAAVHRLGPRSKPLLCTAGVPNDAFWLLAERLGISGTPLMVRADFDPAGITIARSVMDRTGASPWRFGTSNYVDAAHEAQRRGLALPGLVGPVPATPWDVALAPAMASAGVVVFEELLVDELVADLDTDLGAGLLAPGLLAPDEDQPPPGTPTGRAGEAPRSGTALPPST